MGKSVTLVLRRAALLRRNDKSCTITTDDHYSSPCGRKFKADLEAALDILNWAAAHSLPSGVRAEQVNPYTNAPLSVSPLTWSHASLVLAVREYVARWAELGNVSSRIPV